MTTLRTLPEALAAAASTEAGYTFLAPGGAVRRSYAEIRQQALRVARSLEEAGLRRGDLVALVIGDSEQFLTSLFAASIAGLVPVSLFSPATSGDQARYLEMTSGVLRASGARAIVTSSGLVSALSALREHCPSLDIVLSYDTLDAPACEPSRQLSLDDLAFIQFTSGSTSAPKGIALTHRNVAANIAAFAACLDVQKDDVGLSWLPLNHDMGLVGMAIGSVYASVSTVLLTPVMFVKRPAEWLKAITRFRASVSFAPNFAYDLAVRRVKEKDLEGLDLSSWRVAGCGAEPVHAPTLAAFAERFASVGFRETAFLPSYGLAEHVLAATFSPVGRGPRVEQVAAEALTERYLAVPAATGDKTVSLVSCGSQLPGHVLKIVGEDGRRLADREVGVSVLGRPSVMVG